MVWCANSRNNLKSHLVFTPLSPSPKIFSRRSKIQLTRLDTNFLFSSILLKSGWGYFSGRRPAKHLFYLVIQPSFNPLLRLDLWRLWVFFLLAKGRRKILKKIRLEMAKRWLPPPPLQFPAFFFYPPPPQKKKEICQYLCISLMKINKWKIFLAKTLFRTCIHGIFISYFCCCELEGWVSFQTSKTEHVNTTFECRWFNNLLIILHKIFHFLNQQIFKILPYF